MVNPFEETIIAGDVSLTPHDRVQQERDLRIGEAANMYMNTNVTNPTQEATRYVDWKYPTVFGELTPGKSGHPYEGGWGPEHKWARSTDLGYNPLKHILDYSINTVKPAIRDVMGFPQPSWVDEYTNRDVPINWDQVSGKRHPYKGALTGAIIGDPEAKLNAQISGMEAERNKLDQLRREWDQLQMNPLYPPPGPWNEFDPHSKFEEYIDNMNIDEGGSEWSPSEEYLGGTTEVAGTTEEKWGQLVRDGVVNPGDSLNPLQIDQLYNQHYEGGAGDMDQFGVT